MRCGAGDVEERAEPIDFRLERLAAGARQPVVAAPRVDVRGRRAPPRPSRLPSAAAACRRSCPGRSDRLRRLALDVLQDRVAVALAAGEREQDVDDRGRQRRHISCDRYIRNRIVVNRREASGCRVLATSTRSGYCRTSSTRRFWAHPSAVSFEATGCLAPKPRADRRAARQCRPSCATPSPPPRAARRATGWRRRRRRYRCGPRPVIVQSACAFSAATTCGSVAFDSSRIRSDAKSKVIP